MTALLTAFLKSRGLFPFTLIHWANLILSSSNVVGVDWFHQAADYMELAHIVAPIRMNPCLLANAVL